MISLDNDTGRYYFQVFNHKRELLYSPSDADWGKAYRLFFDGGYRILLSEEIGQGIAVVVWKLKLLAALDKPNKKKDWPIFKTVIKKFPLVIDREHDCDRFYFTVYDDSGAPIFVGSGATHNEAYKKIKEEGYRILLEERADLTGSQASWKVTK